MAWLCEMDANEGIYSRCQIASNRPQKYYEFATGVDEPCTAHSLEMKTDIKVYEVEPGFPLTYSMC